MLRKFLPATFLIVSLSLSAQYKNDNILYKTVDPSDLCVTLLKNKGYVLLDVRSKGEYADTSAFGINMGHLKEAVNINVRELGNRLSEIKDYKNQPVFVYCSHSQRSRRASKMLADSGYTNIYNINGGMTAIYYTNAKEKECFQSLLVSNNKYKIISPADICTKLSGKVNNIFLLDVRSDSAFRHISSSAKENAYGYIKGTINIPLAELLNKLNTISKDKEIIITDLYGHDAAEAAEMLREHGFKNVSVLIEGIDRWLDIDENELSCKNNLYVSPVTYHLLNAEELERFANTNKTMLMLDVRTTNEFTNKAKDSWRNIGHIKDAVNIPAADISGRIGELENYKNRDIVVYAFSNSPEMYTAASTLVQQGFTKVHVLVGGLFNIRWTAANVKGKSALKDFVTDVPEINW